MNRGDESGKDKKKFRDDVSTIDDYGHFASMMLHNGWENGHQILRPATAEFLANAGLGEKPQRDFIAAKPDCLDFTTAI